MPKLSEMLNDLLVSAYNNILRIEEEFLQKGIGRGLSIREMHMIEYIGNSGKNGRTLSETADFMKVARPSVTISARKLEGKGFLSKNACEQDGRVTRATLTREGRKVYLHHMRWHTLMVRELENGLDEGEKNILIHAIEKLNSFFESNIEATT
ncbi:MAG: MarR family transcriptional regulator [Oscillospiraceae bacterium]|nr:MarR family transcriptional regulator [Oscillospiraceae bacterium]